MELIDLRDINGRRKYLTPGERRKFFDACENLESQEKAFCYVLFYTGCRISEALALTKEHLDMADNIIVFQCLKKRQKSVYRGVPVPEGLLTTLKAFDAPERLFPFCRETGWRIVKRVMRSAEIEGIHATAKGLRHGFGIAHVCADTPLNLIQRWLGHSSIETTTIYLNAVGEVEKNFAKRAW